MAITRRSIRPAVLVALVTSRTPADPRLHHVIACPIPGWWRQSSQVCFVTGVSWRVDAGDDRGHRIIFAALMNPRVIRKNRWWVAKPNRERRGRQAASESARPGEEL